MFTWLPSHPGSPFLLLSLHYIFCSDVWVSHHQVTSRSLFYIPIILSNAPFLSLKVQYISYPFSLKERERRGLHVSVYFVFHFLALVFLGRYLLSRSIFGFIFFRLRSVPRRLREWKHAVCLSVLWFAVLLRVLLHFMFCVLFLDSHPHIRICFCPFLSLFSAHSDAELNGNLNVSGVKSGSAEVCVLFEMRELSLASLYDL